MQATIDLSTVCVWTPIQEGNSCHHNSVVSEILQLAIYTNNKNSLSVQSIEYSVIVCPSCYLPPTPLTYIFVCGSFNC